MFRSNLSARSLRAVLLTGAATATVFAFTGPVIAQEAETSETVVVTGSRLPQTGLTSVSPVNVIGQEEAKLEGTVTVETLLNNLPSTFAGFSTHDANGSTGTASVNLRGLGPARTLVLIDGRRMMPGDPGFPVADLNAIPTMMVERVEVLTGGASAVYGSDAVAGVVNFIMRKDFEGIEFDGQYTVYNDDNDVPLMSRIIDIARAGGGDALVQFPHAPKNIWDGDTLDGTILMGVNSDNGKANVTAYLGYRRLSAVTQADREYSACSTAARIVAPPGNGIENEFRCFGSANKNLWTSIDGYYAGLPNYYFFQEGTGAPGSGTFTPFTGSSNQRFNFAPYNHIQRPDTRWTGGFFGHYEVEPWLDFYANFMFADDRTQAAIAPSGLFLGQGAGNQPFMFVNCNNPLMTAQERQILCTQFGLAGDDLATVFIGRRNIEGGPRVDDIRHTAYRTIFGVKGDLGDGWSYDVFGQYGYTLFSQLTTGFWSISAAQNALLVHDVAGVPTCDVGGSCVPLDIFNGIGSITDAMLAYISTGGLQSGYTQEKVLGGAIVGDLGSIGFQSPWAKTPFGVVFGGEYRSEGLKFDASSTFSSADLGGGGGAVFSQPFGDFSVREVFTELRIPLIEDAPFAKLLQIHGAYRYSDYSSAGSVNTYSYDAEWQPIDDFRLRASYQRATRAPNVLELFSPVTVGLFGGTDPCSPAANPTPAVLANCSSSHPNPGADVPNAGAGILNCISAQCGVQVGGNTALAPEVSDTRSAGIVLTPTFLPGFSATIDYFDIEVKGFIGVIAPNLTLAQCYVNNNQFFCNLIQRNALNQVWGGGYVVATNQNTGALSTTGWDIAANYQTDLADWDMGNNGSLAFSFIGTWLDELVTQALPGFPSYDCVGFYGLTCGTPNPEWRHKLRVTWSSPWDVDLSVGWRHFAGVDADIDSTNTLIGGSPAPCPAGAGGIHGACDKIDAVIDDFDYIDVSALWHVWENVEIRGGVSNIFNEVPPVVDSNTFGLSSPPFGNGNTFPNVYDPLGRTVFIGATVKM